MTQKTVHSLITESLEQGFDEAFGVARTASERIQQLERDLTDLGNAYAMDEVTPIQLEAMRDELRQRDEVIARLREALAEQGIDTDNL
jgi:hypothetical protein